MDADAWRSPRAGTADGRPSVGWMDRPLTWYLIITGAVCVFFGRTVFFGWVFDDQMDIVLNTFVHSLEFLPEIFSSTVWAGSGMETHLYRPLTTLSFALNHLVSGLEPWSYHLINVLLHGGCSILVFRIGRLWGLPSVVAGLGGLLFAIHPVHVEVVAAAFGRKDLLVTFFSLATIVGHRTAVARGAWRQVLPVVALAGALLSKEVGVVALPLIVAHDWFLTGDRRSYARNPRVPRLYIAYLIVLASFFVVRNQITGGFTVPETSFFDNPLVEADVLTRALTASVVVARGILILVVPLVLSPDYSYNAIPLVESTAEPEVLGTILLVAVIAVGLSLRWGRKAYLTLATIWYGLSILPASNLLVPIGAIFGERFLYLPSVAFCLLVAVGLSKLLRRSATPAWILGLALAAIWGLQTIRYTSAWAADIPLFQWAVAQVPESTKAHHKLGEEQLRAGQLGEAVRSLRRSLEIAPENEFAATTLSQATQQIQLRYPLGTPTLPMDPDILYVLTLNRSRGGAPDEAIDLLEEAVRLDPGHGEALGRLGVLLVEGADTTGGIEYLERALRAKPGFASAWLDLARIRLARGEWEEVREALTRFLEVAGPRERDQVPWARSVLDRLGG